MKDTSRIADMNNPSLITDTRVELLETVYTADRSKWTEDTYVSMGEGVSGIKFCSQWILGMLAHEYSDKWGECSKYARKMHVDPQSLLAYRRVYRKLKEADPDYVPDGYIPWGVLQIIAGEKNPIELIEELSSNNKVTIPEATRYIMERKTGKTVPVKPKVKLKFDESGGLWEIQIAEEDFEKINWELIGKQLMEYLKRLWEA